MIQYLWKLDYLPRNCLALGRRFFPGERRSCTKRHLLSLIGNLQHASSVVKSGRTFLRRMIDLSKRQVHMDGHLRLNAEFRADIRRWATFLDAWNGVSVISTLCRCPIDARLVSDASGSWGCGAYLGNKWFALPWSSCPSWAEVHISVQELLPIVISCAIWGSDMTGRHIRCLCENAAVVVMINKHTSKHPSDCDAPAQMSLLHMRTI